jgi:hypothetical protein
LTNLYKKISDKTDFLTVNSYAHYQKDQAVQISHRNSKDYRRKCRQHIKIDTDGSKKDGEVECAVITPESKIRTRLQPQNTIFSKKQEAIMKVIQVSE